MVGQRSRAGKLTEEFVHHFSGEAPVCLALRAWEFLRSNPLTGPFFRPSANIMHPSAIGRVESMELVAIAAEIRELILRADEVMQPYERQREHDKNMKAIARFYQFCAAHRATNEVAVSTYGQAMAHYFSNFYQPVQEACHKRD